MVALKTQVIELREFTLSLSEADVYMDARKVSLQLGLEAKVRVAKLWKEGDPIPADMSEEEMKMFLDPIMDFVRYSYAPLAASVMSDKVPTLQEYARMTSVDGNKWWNACYELNPDWFTVTPVVPAGETKKEKKRD